MARRSGADLIQSAIETHPLLMTLPAAARFVWMQLAVIMHRHALSVLRFGCGPVSVSEIALMLRMPETELKANLEPLLARGLLVQEADGALAAPLLASWISRSDINRANGLKGGRPRKNREPNGQSSMLLPIAGGGVADGAETEPKPNSTPARSGPQLASSSESEVKLLASRIAVAAKAEAGIHGDPKPDEVRIVAKWLNAGATEAQIIDVVLRRRRAGIQALFYFDKLVMQTLSEPVEAEPPAPRFNQAWNRDVHAWMENGCRGPRPQIADYADAA